MSARDSHLPVPIMNGGGRVSTLDQFAEVPADKICMQKLKSPRTRRAYRQDVRHFMCTLLMNRPEELHQADHKAVIAWKRYMRESEHAAIRLQLAALSGEPTG